MGVGPSLKVRGALIGIDAPRQRPDHGLIGRPPRSVLGPPLTHLAALRRLLLALALALRPSSCSTLALALVLLALRLAASVLSEGLRSRGAPSARAQRDALGAQPLAARTCLVLAQLHAKLDGEGALGALAPVGEDRRGEEDYRGGE